MPRYRFGFHPAEFIFIRVDADSPFSADGMAQAQPLRPPIDMYETDKALIVKMEIPGLEIDDIAITLIEETHQLLVRGERRESAKDIEGRRRCHHLEIYYGAFERLIPLPQEMRFDSSQLSAFYRDGFLIIQLPLVPTARRIEVEYE